MKLKLRKYNINKSIELKLELVLEHEQGILVFEIELNQDQTLALGTDIYNVYVGAENEVEEEITS